MTDKFKDFMRQDLDENDNQEDFDSITDAEDGFFTEVGQLIDSLDNEDVSDDTNDAIDDLIDKIFDVMLTLGDEDFDKKTEDHFYNILSILGIDDEDDVDEGLTVKHRKTNSGRTKSDSAKMKGVNKLKYLKRLKSSRKVYKKSASLRNKTKRLSKKYRKTASAKNVVKKYKSLNK